MFNVNIQKRTPSFIANNWLTNNQAEEIKEFLKRLLFVFLNNNTNDWFTVSDLVGGYNEDWTGTPLQYIYNAYKVRNPDTAEMRAAIDVGWLFLEILDSDKQNIFEARHKNREVRVRQYRKI